MGGFREDPGAKGRGVGESQGKGAGKKRNVIGSKSKINEVGEKFLTGKKRRGREGGRGGGTSRLFAF